jgi:hypothetical protein
MIIQNDKYFYVVLKDKDNRDIISGSFLTKDEALRNLLGLMKQIADYLVEALDMGSDEN